MNIIRMTSSFFNKCFSLINMRTIKRLIHKCFSLTGVRTIKRPVNKCLKDLAFIKKGKVIILGVEILNIQAGHFYFIKDEFFEEIKDKELMVNKENGHMRPCYYCFKDSRNNGLYWFIPVSSKVEKYKAIYDKKLARYKRVDTIVFGYIYGRKSAFLIQNMFPITTKYIKEEYIKQNKEVTVNDDLKKELNTKANRVLELVKAGNKNLVFPNIINIEKYLLKK